VTISNVDTFAIHHLHVLTWPVVEGWIIFEPPWKCGL
jgi:hypothetical protein